MKAFSKAFLRLAAGKWLCKEMATLQSADGRQVQVTPGVTYTRGKQHTSHRCRPTRPKAVPR